MTTKKIKEMLDACYQAKRIREMLPPLPQGVMPSYIQYLDAIQKLEKKDIHVKVSDISDIMISQGRELPEQSRRWRKKVISARLHPQMMDVSLTYLSQKKDGSCFISMMSIISASCPGN